MYKPELYQTQLLATLQGIVTHWENKDFDNTLHLLDAATQIVINARSADQKEKSKHEMVSNTIKHRV